MAGVEALLALVLLVGVRRDPGKCVLCVSLFG